MNVERGSIALTMHEIPDILPTVIRALCNAGPLERRRIRFGSVAWLELHRWAQSQFNGPSSKASATTLMGVPVRLDPDLPPTTIAVDLDTNEQRLPIRGFHACGDIFAP